MKFTIIEAEQRTPDWYAARAGRATGSKAHCIVAQGKGSAEAVTRRDYRLSLACERLTGKPDDSGFVSYDMARGTELEPLILSAYEAQTGNMVRQTGFLAANDYLVGCSLDGDVDGFKGITEWKAPKTNTHLGYWRDSSTLKADYMPQVLHNLWVSGAGYCDLCSFDNRFPEELQLLIVRIERDQSAIDRYAAQVQRFLAEVAIDVQEIKSLMLKEAA